MVTVLQFIRDVHIQMAINAIPIALCVTHHLNLENTHLHKTGHLNGYIWTGVLPIRLEMSSVPVALWQVVSQVQKSTRLIKSHRVLTL